MPKKSPSYSPIEVLHPERMADFKAYVAQYRDKFAPATPAEQLLVDSLARADCFSRYYGRLEAAMWERCLADGSLGAVFSLGSGDLDRVCQNLDAARRDYYSALASLLAMKKRAQRRLFAVPKRVS